MTMAMTGTLGRIYAGALVKPVVRKGELLSVQRLRGLAVLMVLFVHIEDVSRHLVGWADVHTAYTHYLGYSAADLFFVISGFIMAYITFSQPFVARSWAISRFIRIYPMYILFTLLVMLMWLYDPRMTMGTGEQNWGRVLMSLAGLPQAGLPLLFVGWTVEHEILFYTLLFLTARFLGRERLFLVMASLSLLAVLRWLVQQSLGIEIWDWHLTSMYMIEFTIGVFIHRHWGVMCRWGWRGPLAFCALFLVLGMTFSHSGRINEEPLSRVLLFGPAYGGLLLTMLNIERARHARGEHEQHRDALVWVGDASYSVYLTHPFVLGSFGKLFPLVGSSPLMQWSIVLLAAVTTMAVGLVTHVLLERQVMELGRRLSRPRKAQPNRIAPT